MTAFFWLLGTAALAAPAGRAASASAACSSAVAGAGEAPVFSPQMTAELAAPHPYPTFCSIPVTPRDVRSAQVFMGAVATARLSGARLVRQTAPTTWNLADTAAFARNAKSEASPPPPMAPAGDTQAFIAEMRARATPPARPH